MLSPSDDSPKLQHKIFTQLLTRHEPVIRGYLLILPGAVERHSNGAVEREKVGCHAPLKNRVTGRFVR